MQRTSCYVAHSCSITCTAAFWNKIYHIISPVSACFISSNIYICANVTTYGQVRQKMNRRQEKNNQTYWKLKIPFSLGVIWFLVLALWGEDCCFCSHVKNILLWLNTSRSDCIVIEKYIFSTATLTHFSTGRGFPLWKLVRIRAMVVSVFPWKTTQTGVLVLIHVCWNSSILKSVWFSVPCLFVNHMCKMYGCVSLTSPMSSASIPPRTLSGISLAEKHVRLL